MSLPKHISPGARARRALLLDVVLAGLLATVALSLAAGLGVVSFFALPLLVVGLASIAIERLLGRIRRGSKHAGAQPDLGRGADDGVGCA